MIKISKINPINIWAFISGYFRYHLHYRFPLFYKLLVRKHIREQIEYRINSVYGECYEKGYCIHCGCSVTALQHASKTCDGLCYPEMIEKKRWLQLKDGQEAKKLHRHARVWEVDHKLKKFFIIERLKEAQ
jgi:hypothetical protein